VIHWQESAEIFSRLSGVAAAGGRAALATVVRIVGSAYRRPGARLLVEAGGESLGGVSGGCLEADVREVAAQVLATGVPRLLHYDTGAGDEPIGLGLGCRGLVDVFVQPATEGPLAELAPAWRRRLAADEAFVAVTVVGGAAGVGAARLVGHDGGGDGSFGDEELDRAAVALAAGRLAAAGAAMHSAGSERPPVAPLADGTARRAAAACEEIAGRLVFVEPLTPPPHLVVCGAGDDAVPLVALAASAGFRVSVLDHRQRLLDEERFPAAWRRGTVRPEDGGASAELPPAGRSLGVVMTHSLAHDREWVRRLLAAGLPYVGLLGPRERAAEVRREIGAEGDERLHGPVGLDLGADGPRQVAVSVVAELLAVLSGRRPRPLTERKAAIHAG
jgi:xanthine dehydrogenase accessory factor